MKDCVFCNLPPDRGVKQTEKALAFYDAFPVTTLHTLIIPRRHTADLFDLTCEELTDMLTLIRECKEIIQQIDSSVTGFNVGVNCGTSAGQTVMHAHIHLIPRRDGDVEQPRGGVRGCIPNKMSY